MNLRLLLLLLPLAGLALAQYATNDALLPVVSEDGALEVPAVEYRDISSTRAEEGSAAIRDRVGGARERQQSRFRSDKKINCNARMGPRQIKQHCKLSDESQELIRVAMTELNLSARAYDRILKVSRTMADLHSSDDITTEHVSEAIQYRTFDRTLWV